MKITVISDTHIPIKAKEIPQAVLKSIAASEMVIHAGDLVDLRLLKVLKSACPDVKAVWGNMDSQELRQILPQKLIFTVKDKFKFGLMHGWGKPDNLIENLSDAFKDHRLDVIIFGHSHQAFNKKVRDTLFFNPGSLTDKDYSPYNSYGIIKVTDKIETSIIKI